MMRTMRGWSLAATLLLANGCAHAGLRDGECSRYVDSLKRPEVAARLEEWFHSLPTKFDPQTLKRSSGRVRLAKYQISLPFDPATVGLRPEAQAQLRVSSAGELESLYLTDHPGVWFSFMMPGKRDFFLHSTLVDGRKEFVGVTCLVRD